jgi:hypothetical protein
MEMDRTELESKVDSFIEKYEGKEKGFPNDTLFKGECLSIVKIYIEEVFGISAPPSGTGSAFGYWLNFPNPLPNTFEKVEKTTGVIPKKGDIPIWSVNEEAHRPFGHIDIFISGDDASFIGFDQNWNGKQAHKQKHGYNGIVGWLTPIVEGIPIPPETGLFSVTVTTEGDGLRIRTGPGTRFRIIRNLRTDDRVTVFGLSGNNVWLRVQEGFIMFKPEWLKINSGGEEIPPEAGLFNVTLTPEGDGLRIRTGPGTRFKIIRNLRTGDQVTVSGLSGNNVWLRVREGYIMFKPEWLKINSGG